MKMSRRERKIFEAGKRAGFEAGYKKGLYDGNPFNTIFEAVSKLAETLQEAMKNNPEFAEQVRLMKENPEYYDELLKIEEDSDNDEC